MNTKTILTALLAAAAMGATAQTENPRGIYKMTTLTGSQGEIPAPFEQYKICTDSITLMVAANNQNFNISHNDHVVFNYTGAHHKNDSIKTPLVYDSNADGFKLKWWSTYRNHKYFPNNDWCIEKYESNKYSLFGKAFFDALTGTYDKDSKNPVIGTWRFFGYVDELRDVKKALPKMHKDYSRSRYYKSFLVFTPKFMVTLTPRGGHVSVITFQSRNTYLDGTETCRIKKLAKNRIAVEMHNDFHTDWMILERVPDNITPLNEITRLYLYNE